MFVNFVLTYDLRASNNIFVISASVKFLPRAFLRKFEVSGVRVKSLSDWSTGYEDIYRTS
jgi:hypothetical protein